MLIIGSTDPSFVRHYAGNVENGFDSVSDPHIGASDQASAHNRS